LSSFFCEKDPDLTSFLLERAVQYEKIHKARTYLVVDEESLTKNELVILGYFSLALQSLNLSEDVSVRKRGLMDGVSGKRKGEKIISFPCFLIGQLARCSYTNKGDMPGTYFLHQALQYIALAQDAVSGRIVLVECKPEQKLIQFYIDHDFEEFARISDKDGKQMVQLIRMLN
jgi:hypothetical protein